MSAKKERVKGECVNWYKHKVFGFIKMDDGETVFVHKRDLQGADELNFGDRVEFEVETNPRNHKRMAVRVTIIEDEREPETFVVDDKQQKGVVKTYYKLKGYGFIQRHGHDQDTRFEMKDASFVDGDSVLFQIATGARGSIRARNVKLDPEVVRERVKGECIRWNKMKGFGFIRVDDGEEIFVHVRDVQSGDTLDFGDRVEFEVVVNPRKKKNAVRVTVIEDEREPETFAVDDEEHKGLIGVYFQQDGYGYIKKGGQDKDIRFDLKDADFVKGDAVTFQIATGSRGSIQARNVTVDSNVSRERVKGECVDWNKRKGFGFVKVDDGQDVFVHCMNVQGHDALNVGDLVEFEVVNSKNGKKMAVRVTKAEPETKKTSSRKRKLESSGDVSSPPKKRKTNGAEES